MKEWSKIPSIKGEGVISFMDYNRAAMKQEVKQTLRQARPHPMLVTLLFLVIAGIVASLISSFMSTLSSRLTSALFSDTLLPLEELLEEFADKGPDFLENYFAALLEEQPQQIISLLAMSSVISMVTSILVTIWNGLMNVGYAGYCLDVSRSANPPLTRIFSGFSRAGSAIPAYILVAIFTFLWTMLFAICYGVLLGIAFLIGANDSLAILGVLLMLVATGGYIFALLWVVFRYAMVPFVVIDGQQAPSAMKAIRTSKNLMKGRKVRYFVLQLSFIGWYLLRFLVILLGAIIATVAVIASAGSLENISSYTVDLDLAQFLTGVFAPVLIVSLLCSAVIFVINLWLTPYITSCEARFYDYAAGGQPSLSDAQGGQSSLSVSYDGQPGPYGGQPGPFGGQPVSYDGQPGPFGGQPVSYDSQPGPYGGQPSPYGGQPGPFGGQPSPYGSQPVSYDSQPGPFGGQPVSYDSQPGPYGGQPSPYGGQPGPYSGGPYGYTPPSQSPFGGFTPGAQPPQWGESAYPQWGAPQPPQAPVFSATEPLVPEAPVPPVFSATEPLVPEVPAAPEIPVAPGAETVPLFPEDAGGFDPPSQPTAIFTPDDETPQPPKGPNYPQS